MSLKTSFILISIMFIPIISGCNSGGKELLVGFYENEESIIFLENLSVNDLEVIEEFQNIIINSPSSSNVVSGLPDYVITINNKNKSASELFVNIWIKEDNTITFSRGFKSSEYYSIDNENTMRVKELINLD